MLKKVFIVEKSKKIIDVLQDYGFGFADANKILRAKDVKINKKSTKHNVLVEVGDEITVFYSQEMMQKKFEIVFEDSDVLIVYKRAGIETAGEKGVESVLGAIAVHRLDRNTEGLVIFAKNESAKKKLLDAFKKNLIHKFYIAEVVGCCKLETKLYKAYLLKDAEKSQVQIFSHKLKDAVEIQTQIKEIIQGAQTSLLKVSLLTGKTHQIRAHLAYLGYPIVGDGKYGKNEINKKFGQKTQKLACFRLKFEYLGLKGVDNKEFEAYPEWRFVK